MYVYPRFVRRAVCARCGAVSAPEHVGELHTHKQRGVVLVARMTREPLFPVEQRNVDGALEWLDEHWQGEPYIPDELLPLVSAACRGSAQRLTCAGWQKLRLRRHSSG
jgi:hypothetical protein